MLKFQWMNLYKYCSCLKREKRLLGLRRLGVRVPHGAPFYFAVGESKEITSEPCEFTYPADGVSGKLILDRSGKVDIQLSVLQRYPMPEITIDGKAHALTEDLTDGLIQVRSEEDRAEITASVLAGKKSTITLPNGKELKVSAAENTYTYLLDGMEKTYIPAVSYTGYYTSFSYEFPKVKGESLTETKTEVSFSEAGSNPNRLKGTLTHTPKTKEQKQADGITKIVGMLDKDGNQVFTHRLDFTMTDEKGQQAVTIGKKPEEPEKPQRPEKPEKPSKPEKPKNPQEVPKTGDAANAAGYLLLLAGAAAGLVFSTGMLRKRRKTNR